MGIEHRGVVTGRGPLHAAQAPPAAAPSSAGTSASLPVVDGRPGSASASPQPVLTRVWEAQPRAPRGPRPRRLTAVSGRRRWPCPGPCSRKLATPGRRVLGAEHLGERSRLEVERRPRASRRGRASIARLASPIATTAPDASSPAHSSAAVVELVGRAPPGRRARSRAPRRPAPGARSRSAPSPGPGRRAAAAAACRPRRG